MFMDSYYKIHLNWMFDNQPHLVRQLMRSNKLKDHLDQKEQAAVDLVAGLKEKMSLPEAWEIATQQIYAPPDGPAMSDSPPKPLDWRERKAIYSYLEKAGDRADLEESREAQKH